MFALLLVAACAVVPYHKPPEVTPVGPPVEAPASNAAIAPLLVRLDSMLASTTETDTRDRLVELRDLLVGVQLGNPTAQAAVVRYADRALVIEERARPFVIAESPMELATTFDAVVEETIVDAPEPLAAARALLGSGKPLQAVEAVDAALATSPGLPGAVELRKAAVDKWADAERERAGADFLTARALKPGPERTAALGAVETTLAAINIRFPDNAYAADVAQHLATVRKELTP